MTEGNLPKRGIAAIVPEEAPTADALFGAIGGVRGIIESLAPGLVFLVVFTVTGQLVPSVAAPVTVAVVSLLVRLIQRLPVLPAVSGGIGIAFSADALILLAVPSTWHSTKQPVSQDRADTLAPLAMVRSSRRRLVLPAKRR